METLNCEPKSVTYNLTYCNLMYNLKNGTDERSANGIELTGALLNTLPCSDLFQQSKKIEIE